MKTKIFTCLLIGAFLLFSGCSDENEEENRSEVFTALTAHPWIYDSFYTICNDPEILWWFNLLDSSFTATNYVVSFKEDHTFLGSLDGYAKWKFNNEETEIIIVDDDDPTDIYNHVRIDELTEDILKCTDLGDVPPSDTCYVQFLYRK